MNNELSDKSLEHVSGGSFKDPISGYDYQQILQVEALICGDWVYDEFMNCGAAGLKNKMREKFGDTWFVKKFPIFDQYGKIVG